MKEFFRECNSFTWRWNRQKFWLYPIYMLLLLIVPLMILSAFTVGWNSQMLQNMTMIAIWISYIYILYVSICAYIKRFHDLDKSGWYTALVVVPVLNILIWFWAGFTKGTDGPNQFWPDPLGWGAPEPTLPQNSQWQELSSEEAKAY